MATSSVKKSGPFSRPFARKVREHAKEFLSKKSSKDLEKHLRVIYGEDASSGALEIVRRPRSSPWRRRVWFFFFSVFFLTCLVWLGFFLSQPLRSPAQSGLTLSLSGPSDITLGRVETFTLHWTNQGLQPLLDARVRLNIPSDFLLVSSEPLASDPTIHRWDLGLVSPQQEGSILIKGIFTGALGSASFLQAVGSARVSPSANDEPVLSTLALRYASSVLSADLENPPTQVVAGDPVILRYRIANQGDQALGDLRLRAVLPKGFVASSASSSGADFFLSLPKLAPGASSTVEVAGMFASGVSGDSLFRFEAGRFSDKGFISMHAMNFHLPVIAGDLLLQVAVNGASSDRSLEPGDVLRISVAYQNTSQEALHGVALQLGFESLVNDRSATGTSLLLWAGLDDASRGVTSTKPRIQTIRYDKAQFPALANLAPQSQGSFDLTIPTLPVASGTRDAFIRLIAQADIQSIGKGKAKRVVRAEPITIRYRSDARAYAEARYYTEEGAPLGFGPIPPVAGKITAYRVFWRIHKQFHALDEARMSAVLPKIAAWGVRASVDAGSLSYDSSTRMVVWSLDRIPEDAQDVEANFEVQMTPEIFDIGRFAAVLGETRFQARDPIVKETINGFIPPLTTDLQTDDGAKGKGVVRKQ